VTGTKDTTIRELSPGSRREPRVSLVFYFRDGAKIVVPGPQPIVVGRSYPADVVVDDPSVSRAHARFFVDAGGNVVFEDLGSTNGTRLNGTAVPRGTIGPSDEVRVGDVVVALHSIAVVPGVQGLHGYDALVRLLEDEIVRARTFARPASLLMVGARSRSSPAPLRTWAPLLLEKLRPVDRAAVYADDTVLVSLPEAGRTDADALGASIVAADPALRFGAATFPENGGSVDELLDAARSAMTRGGAPPPPPSSGAPIVAGARLREVWEMAQRVATSSLPILVVGETGSGKEVVARAVHEKSGRTGPLRSVNCAAIPQSLVESVLFGHEKGAFTGADRTTKGLFEQASGGTLLLDEVGELPPSAQAALLRVLESKRLMRVGGDREIAIDVRVIAATHRDLERMCAEGSFRSDLFYRLHGVTLNVPPLRERADEIAALAKAFLDAAARENARSVRGFDDEALAALSRWHWPGNVRELKNVVERGVVVARSDLVTLGDLPERMRAVEVTDAPRRLPSSAPPAAAPDVVDPSLDYKERLRVEMQRYERNLILDALAKAEGNVTAAAQALKIPVRTLTHKMQSLGIKKRFDG
jgi:DNA-binding NtrC family response regulator